MIQLYLGDLTLPPYANDGFTEIPQPNIAKNYPLDGSMYVDVYNRRRAWQIKWDYLKPEEYQAIKEKWENQFSASQPFIYFGKPDEGINVPVFITVSDIKPKWSGRLIKDFSITLEEQYAVS